MAFRVHKILRLICLSTKKYNKLIKLTVLGSYECYLLWLDSVVKQEHIPKSTLHVMYEC